jgi:hypothetical protein
MRDPFYLEKRNLAENHRRKRAKRGIKSFLRQGPYGTFGIVELEGEA